MGARRVVTVILDAIPTGFVAGLRTSAVAAKEFGKELDTMAVKHTSAFKKISNTMGLVGAGLVGAFALAEKATIAFDTQMSKVGAVADASAKQLDQLRAAALQAGKDTAFTATEAAQAEEELAKAGVNTADILGGALAGTLNLAAAGSLSLADAATIAAKAMVEFGLKGKDVGHIADILASGANQSVASVSSLGQALDQVGALASQRAHFGLAETVGVLSAFSQHGLDGAEAGTALKTALLRLMNPTEKAANLMQHLGISMYDSNGQFVNAAEVANQLQAGLGGLTEAQRNADLGILFGTRAIRGAIVLYQLGAKGVQQWTDQVNASGVASATSKQKLDNLSGDIHKLGGSLQALAIGTTSQANQGLRFLAQGAEGAANAFASLPGPVQAVTGDIVVLTGVTLLGAAGFMKIRGAMLEFNASLAASGPLGEKLAGWLGGLGGKAGPLALAGIGLAGLAYGFHALLTTGKDDFKPVTRDVDALTASLQALADTGKIAGYLASTFGKDLSKLGTELKSVTLPSIPVPTTGSAGHQMALENLNDALHHSATQGVADAKAISAALLGIVQAGGTSTAHLAFLDVEKQLLSLGVPMATINKLFADYIMGAHNAAIGSAGVAQGFADVSQAVQIMNKGMLDAIQHGETLDSVFKELNGTNIDATQAAITFNQDLASMVKALTGTDKALTKHKRSLDIATQAGRDNQTMVIGLIKDAETYAQTIYDKVYAATNDQAAATDAATKAYNNHIAALRATLNQAGFTGKQIDWLISQYGRMPAAVSTQINAPGLPSVLGGLQQIYTWIGKVNGKTATIRVDTEHLSTGPLGHSVNRWGGMYQHAAVGSLREAVYSPPVARGARYAWAEPETKGEIFIPKAGNYGRSMALIRAAAGWYGASVSPSGGGGGVTFNVHADAAAFWRFMRLEVQNHGGSAKAFT